LDVLQGWLSGPGKPFAIAWSEHSDAFGFGKFGSPRIIRDGPAGLPGNVFARDLDRDGDLDVLATVSLEAGEIETAWYENRLNEGGGFESKHVLAIDSRLVAVADFDGDGDDDLVSSIDSNLVWYKNLLPRLTGDANRDGLFKSSDLVQVFQRGEYEDGIENNSTWMDGDWNDDREFNSSDLVVAFQTGLYEVEPQVNPGKIAAAVDWLFFDDDQRDTRQRAYVA
jgi:hypothetical protein